MLDAGPGCSFQNKTSSTLYRGTHLENLQRCNIWIWCYSLNWNIYWYLYSFIHGFKNFTNNSGTCSQPYRNGTLHKLMHSYRSVKKSICAEINQFCKINRWCSFPNLKFNLTMFGWKRVLQIIQNNFFTILTIEMIKRRLQKVHVFILLNNTKPFI